MPSYRVNTACSILFMLLGSVALFLGLYFRYSIFPSFAYDFNRSRFLNSPSTCTSTTGLLKDSLCERNVFAAWKLSTDELEKICLDTKNEPDSEVLKLVSGWSGDPAKACPRGKKVKFYVFNVTNPESISVSGTVPQIQELPPVHMFKKEGKIVSEEDKQHWEATGNARYSNTKKYVLMEGQEELIEKEVILPYLAFWTSAFSLNYENLGNIEALLGGYVFVGAMARTLGVFESLKLSSAVFVPVAASLGFSTLKKELEERIFPRLVPELADRLGLLADEKHSTVALARYLSQKLNVTVSSASLLTTLTKLQLSGYVSSLCSMVEADCSFIPSEDREMLQQFVAGNISFSIASSFAHAFSSPDACRDVAGNCRFSAADCSAVSSYLVKMAKVAFKKISGVSLDEVNTISLLKLQLASSGLSRTITEAYGVSSSRTLRDLSFLLGEDVKTLPVLSALAAANKCIDSTYTPEQCRSLPDDKEALSSAGVALTWSLVELAIGGDSLDSSLASIIISFHLFQQSFCKNEGVLVASGQECQHIHSLFLSALALNSAATSPNFGVPAGAAPFFVKMKVKDVLGIMEGDIPAGTVDPWFGELAPKLSFSAATSMEKGKTEVIRTDKASEYKGVGFFVASDGKTKDCRYDLDCVLPRQLSLDPNVCEGEDDDSKTFCKPRKVTGYTDIRFPGTLYGREGGTKLFDAYNASATIFSEDLFSTVNLRLHHRRELWAPQGVSSLKRIEVNRWRVVQVEAREENCDGRSGGSRGIDCDSPKRTGNIGMLVQWPNAPPLYASSPHFFNDEHNSIDDDFPNRDVNIYDPLDRVRITPCSSPECENREFHSELLVEPASGLVISGVNRLMVNARLEWKKAKKSSVLLGNFGGENPDMADDFLIPLYWLEEEGSVTNHQFDSVYGASIFFDLAEVARFASIIVVMLFVTISRCFFLMNISKHEANRRKQLPTPAEEGENAENKENKTPSRSGFQRDRIPVSAVHV